MPLRRDLSNGPRAAFAVSALSPPRNLCTTRFSKTTAMSQSHYSLSVLFLALGCGGAEPPPAAPVAPSTPSPAAPAPIAATPPPVAAALPAAPMLGQAVNVGLKNSLPVA